ncbi:MAG: hypothetical protein HQ541_19085 [Mariniphaga sp.]|nr:hypothetical protein [Mariniphaga sp.]
MKAKYSIILYLLFSVLFSFSQSGDILSMEEGLKQRNDIIFFGGFEESYNNSNWVEKWGISWNNRANETEIVENTVEGGKSLRVTYPAGGVGPQETGGQFPMIFNDMKGINHGFYRELYLRYYVKFEDGFDFRLGGKLPGLMGGGNSWSRSGGKHPNGKNGWTLRFMWGKEGKIVVYTYVPKSANGEWGRNNWGQSIDCDFKAIPGKWHCIEEYVNVGTPNTDDGKLKVWIDGKEKLNISNMRFWDVENNNGLIGGIYFSTFHGGNSKDWAPNITSYIQFDGFVAGTNRIGQ